MGVECIYVLIAIALVGAFQLFYWSFFMFRISKRKGDSLLSAKGGKLPPVSIIVCARNEAENLKKLVPALMAQRYPEKQVVVVDDASDDDTELTLAQLRSEYPQLYYTSIPKDGTFVHSKKLAVTVGIKAAKYSHLLFTDADCMPVSSEWVLNMMEPYGNGQGVEMVVGYGRYAKLPGLLNLFIRFETFFNAVQYMGFAKAMRPFMGVGRNMSYTKSLYEQSSKFRKHWKIQSGDDDLFISEVGTRKNTDICFAPDGQTVSEPKRTWKEWSAQKSRHFTTAPHYRWGTKIMLGLELLTRQLLLWGALVILIYNWNLNDVLPIVTISLLGIRWILMHTALGIAASRMHRNEDGGRFVWLWTIPADILMPWVQLAAWWTGYASKSSNRWK